MVCTSARNLQPDHDRLEFDIAFGAAFRVHRYEAPRDGGG